MPLQGFSPTGTVAVTVFVFASSREIEFFGLFETQIPVWRGDGPVRDARRLLPRGKATPNRLPEKTVKVVPGFMENRLSQRATR